MLFCTLSPLLGTGKLSLERQLTSEIGLLTRTFEENNRHSNRISLDIAVLSLREIDIELMKRLSPRINVIPVIGKSDTLTPSELSDFKKRVSINWRIGE